MKGTNWVYWASRLVPALVLLMSAGPSSGAERVVVAEDFTSVN